MTAPLYPLSEFTPEQAAKVAEFEAAPTPPEVLREQLACAFAETVGRASTRPRDYDLADAALAVFRGQQDPAVQRVLALADELDHEARGYAEDADRLPHSDPQRSALLGRILGKKASANRIRAAIGGDGR